MNRAIEAATNKLLEALIDHFEQCGSECDWDTTSIDEASDALDAFFKPDSEDAA